MNTEEFRKYRRWEDTKTLEGLHEFWMYLTIMKSLEPEDSYWARLALTADECICKLEHKMLMRSL